MKSFHYPELPSRESALTPPIPGLNAHESLSVYAGDYSPILRRIDTIPIGPERNQAVLEIVDAIHRTALKTVQNAEDALYENDPKNAELLARSFAALCRCSAEMCTVYKMRNNLPEEDRSPWRSAS